MMTQLGSLKILEVMSEAVNVIAEGEVLRIDERQRSGYHGRELYARHLQQDGAPV